MNWKKGLMRAAVERPSCDARDDSMEPSVGGRPSLDDVLVAQRSPNTPSHLQSRQFEKKTNQGEMNRFLVWILLVVLTGEISSADRFSMFVRSDPSVFDASKETRSVYEYCIGNGEAASVAQRGTPGR